MLGSRMEDDAGGVGVVAAVDEVVASRSAGAQRRDQAADGDTQRDHERPQPSQCRVGRDRRCS